MMKELTKEEAKAVKSLEKVAKTWPKTLWLWSGSGQLCVMKDSWSEMGDGMNKKGSVDKEGFVAAIKNIRNDGGDW